MNLAEFVRESNRIEGILRDPTQAEISALDAFLEIPEVSVGDLCAFVEINQPGAVLRDRVGLDVRVGRHFPPRGGPHIRDELQNVLDAALTEHPFKVHVAYERLHPFTDGNGRSGRALWAWGMHRSGVYVSERLFLHEFYYQTLRFCHDDA